MTTRKATVDVDDEQPSKRRRANETAFTASASLNGVNDDCLLLILSHLPTEDLNNVAMCSRRFREARNHESLDQTRMGTIICSDAGVTSVRSLFDNIASNRWNEVFQGNYTSLKIVGVENLVSFVNPRDFWRQDCVLHGVTKVDLSCSSRRAARRFLDPMPMLGLSLVLPNVKDLDFSFVSGHSSAFCLISRNIPRLQRLSWKGCMDSQDLNGLLLKEFACLTELNLDDSHFYSLEDNVEELWTEPAEGQQNIYMFMHCSRLERLSIKGAIWNPETGVNDVDQPFSQEMLIKMVRHHPTLRWLRSDLSEANVAILKQERPEITFACE